jgi:hypothetical protein
MDVAAAIAATPAAERGRGRKGQSGKLTRPPERVLRARRAWKGRQRASG